MKIHHLPGMMGGILFVVGVLAWRVFSPDSPDLHPAAAPGLHSGHPEANSDSGNRTQSPEPQGLAGGPAPKPAAELPGEDMSERRCLQLAERDPRAALELAIDTLPNDAHPGLFENLAGQWAVRDFQAAHEWALQQEPGEWRDGLMAHIAFAGAQSDPAAAARMVVEEMAPGQQQTEAAISVLHQWGLRDPGAAAAWAATFPPGDLRARAQAEIEGIRQYTSNRTQP
jgi:hypothetical protein